MQLLLPHPFDILDHNEDRSLPEPVAQIRPLGGTRMAASVLTAVVDDDDSAREAIAGLVRALGHDALEFTCAADLLRFRELPRIDCLITDMRMPGLTGLELHRHLVAMGVAVPTLLVTAYPSEATRLQALAAGVCAYLPKPLQALELLEQFRRIEDR